MFQFNYLQIGDSVGFTGLLHILNERLKGLLGVLDAKDGLGAANTALAFHAGQLLMLHEGDLPYAVSFILRSLGLPKPWHGDILN